MGIFDPDRHDNLLGITDLAHLNELEALGILRAQEFILDLDLDLVFDTKLIIDIHKAVFTGLYDWAGKWRSQVTNIGIAPQKVPYAVIEYAEQVNFLKSRSSNQNELIDTLCYVHHRYTQIHPFNNGNGRTARLITDLIANLNGYQNIQLYIREDGKEREGYKAALKAADNFDNSLLKDLISQRLLLL
ncbi:Fic/DOC family protein [Mucilaginibacter pedocola]|nr:Fic family protein [Mucilaginibacter pedocola]